MIWREGLRFGLVGFAQILIDWGVFVLLTAILVPVLPSNVLARIAGASFGFLANATFTFSRCRREPLSRAALLRFALLWTLTTLISTYALFWIEVRWGLASAWLLKPIVDLLLAGVGFFVSRHWVFR